MEVNDNGRTTTLMRITLALVVMSAGRAMTLGWIGRAGDGGPGDPPAAWLMPLVGDAAVGLSALVVAYLLWARRSPTAWAVAIAWSAVAAFDALAALLVDLQTPWPDFFMLELFGRSMFVMAAAMHLVIIGLLFTPQLRAQMGVATSGAPQLSI